MMLRLVCLLLFFCHSLAKLPSSGQSSFSQDQSAQVCTTPCDCPEFFACVASPTSAQPERRVCSAKCSNATECLEGNACFQKTCRKVLSGAEGDACPPNEVFDGSLNKCLCAGIDSSCGVTGCGCMDCNALPLFTVFPDGSVADTGERAARVCGDSGRECECLGNAQSCGLDPTRCVVCEQNEICNAQGECECDTSDFSCPTAGGMNCVNCAAQGDSCVPNPQRNGTFQCGCDDISGDQCVSGTCNLDANLCECLAATAGSNVQCPVGQVCGRFGFDPIMQQPIFTCGVTDGCATPADIDPQCPNDLPPELVCDCLYGFPPAIGDMGFLCNQNFGVNGTCQSAAILSVFTKQNQIEPEQAQTWQQVFQDLQIVTSILRRVGSILNQLYAASFDPLLDLRVDPVPEEFRMFNFTCEPPPPKNVSPTEIDGSGVFTVNLADLGGNSSDLNQLINYTECTLRYAAFPNVDRVISCLERNYFNDTNPLASASILQASILAPRLKNNAVQKRSSTDQENSGEIANTAQMLTNALSNLAGAFKTRLFILQDYIKFRSLSCTEPPYDEVKFCFNLTYWPLDTIQCGLGSCAGTSLNCGQNVSSCSVCNSSAAQTCAPNNTCACLCGGSFPDGCFGCALGQVCEAEQCVSNCVNGVFNNDTGVCECESCWSGRFCDQCNLDSCDSHACANLANGTMLESSDPNAILSCTPKLYFSSTFGDFQCSNAALGGVAWLNNSGNPLGCLRPNSSECYTSHEQGIPAFCERAREKHIVFDPTLTYNHTQAACANGAHYNTVQSRCMCADDWTGCFCDQCNSAGSLLLEDANGTSVCVPKSHEFPQPHNLSESATIRYQCSNSNSGGVMHVKSIYSPTNGKFVAVPCFDNGQAQGGLDPSIAQNASIIDNPDSTTTQPCFNAQSEGAPEGCVAMPETSVSACKHGTRIATGAAKNTTLAGKFLAGSSSVCVCEPGWTGNDCSRCRHRVSSYHCPARVSALRRTNVSLPDMDEQCEPISWLNYCRFPDGTELHTINQCSGDGEKSYQQCFTTGKRLTPRCFTDNQLPNTLPGEPLLVLGQRLEPQQLVCLV